jgi:hypothetical protein
MGRALKKTVLLVVAGMFLFCCVSGCRSSNPKTASTGQQPTMTKEAPKPWGMETRENLLRETAGN